MVAELVEHRVIIREMSEGNRIYSKGCFGTFDGTLTLDLIEACYLLEKERIAVRKNGKKLNVKKMMEHALSFMPDFEIKYLVYRDLRERGYVVRAGDDFLLYSRGKKPPAKASFTVKALSERARFTIREIDEYIANTDLRVMVGIIDEEGDVTYYLAKFFEMRGTLEERKYSGKIILMNDRCITWDEELMEQLRESHIGKDFGVYMQLSLTEASYLATMGATIVKNKRKASMKRFIEHARNIQPDIEDRLKAYTHLRKLKLLPKTGFKFGSHFRVYDNEPEKSHAPYLVHVVKSDYGATWAEISRAVRLAHSVKKEMVFCMIDDDKLKYIRLKRITP